MKKPIIGHYIYKYFGIETPRYKRWWKNHAENIQMLLSFK